MATLILTDLEAEKEKHFLAHHKYHLHKIRYIIKRCASFDNVTIKCSKCHTHKNLSKT